VIFSALYCIRRWPSRPPAVMTRLVRLSAEEGIRGRRGLARGHSCRERVLTTTPSSEVVLSLATRWSHDLVTGGSPCRRNAPCRQSRRDQRRASASTAALGDEPATITDRATGRQRGSNWPSPGNSDWPLTPAGLLVWCASLSTRGGVAQSNDK
jgi:hypothetical protein